jgi:putative transposase
MLSLNRKLSKSASFWLGVCNDLKNRGVADILIACKDGLSGFSEAITTVFPQTEIQLCVIHQIRNSLKYVSYKDQKAIMVDLKTIYQALTLEEAELSFAAFKEKWGKKHPIVIRSWQNNWLELTNNIFQISIRNSQNDLYDEHNRRISSAITKGNKNENSLSF